MESRDVFANLSPLDHRYSLSDPELFARLSAVLSEGALIRYCVRAEVALLKALIARGVADPEGGESASFRERLLAGLDERAAGVSAEEVYAEEARTRHNVRALVNVLKRHLPEQLRPFVHLGATSVDILDTVSAMRIRDAVKGTVLPLLLDLESELARIAREEADTPQIGRTHGQHAVPITFGFAVAEYVSRLGKSIARVHEKSKNLRGKLSGAVGAYNATSLLVGDPEGLERDFLSSLALAPSEHSTQLVEPEYVLELLLELNTAFSIIANLSDDLRNLQRTEIGEVREEFAEMQVGSSTMPQKRNPWNSEHVKSLWKAFCPRVLTFFMDQISEHQRDLTNSASSRFIAEYIVGFASAVSRMLSVARSLAINRKRMAENLARSGDLLFSEPVYVIAALGGDADAHERVRKATLQAERTGESLTRILERDGELWGTISRRLAKASGIEADTFFSDPANYRGIAAERARAISEKYGKFVDRLRGEIGL
jgi:adenylosuccinate lyase